MRSIIRLLWMSGVLLAGCGDTIVPEEHGTLVTREDELPSCRNSPCSPGWVCDPTSYNCVRACSYPDSSPCLAYGQECCPGYYDPAKGIDVPPHCCNAI